MSAEPLTPWVVVQECGTVEAAHCTCMAGLGEACSHIGALLFFLMASWEQVSNTACTSKQCAWTAPPKKRPAAELTDINFTGPSKKMRGVQQSGSTQTASKFPIPSESEKEDFLRGLHSANSSASILAISTDYAAGFVQPPLPLELESLFDSALVGQPYDVLKAKAENVLNSMTCTKDEQRNAERLTVKQRDSRDWFALRAGRVTASNFKSVMATNPTQPAKSVLMNVCSAAPSSFVSPATEWGKQHEKGALASYEQVQAPQHTGFSVQNVGVYVSTETPYVAASPDGCVSCGCCGRGVLEIKCPFKARNLTLDEFLADKQSCLAVDDDGVAQLKRDHAYFYQVQLQMYAADATYCDFLICSQKFMVILRIAYEPHFIRDKLDRLRTFMVCAVLPQMLAHHFFGM